ncbi:hypothetical protein [Hymenobacter norwichensis]|uniref:hypothetical protein n=1 Tax=Hymenobacter norwichensis TaxID=223903 RepID=UPI0003B41B61|nr:hypothetical protein [Hymenobacter norwichensis]
MNKLLLLSSGLALINLAPPTYKTYHNQRFGYYIDYLADMKPQPEPENGDGRRFLSPDGQTVLIVFAGYAAEDDGLNKRRQVAREDWQEKHATFTLDQTTRTGYVLSGKVKGRIFYERTVIKNYMLTVFIWQYPAARKAAMDAVIQHTIQTLQPSV